MNIRINFAIAAFQFKSSYTINVPSLLWHDMDDSRRSNVIYKAIIRMVDCEYREVHTPYQALRVVVILKMPTLQVEEEREWNISGEDWQDMDGAEKKAHLHAAILQSLSWSYSTDT